MSNSTWLVVGLGNPGPDYAANRHNVGQMVLDILADRISASFKSHKANASVAEGRIGFGGPKVILAKPGTYMNNSGGPVANLMKFYDVDVQHVIVVHDELGQELGIPEGERARLNALGAQVMEAFEQGLLPAAAAFKPREADELPKAPPVPRRISALKWGRPDTKKHVQGGQG